MRALAHLQGTRVIMGRVQQGEPCLVRALDAPAGQAASSNAHDAWAEQQLGAKPYMAAHLAAACHAVLMVIGPGGRGVDVHCRGSQRWVPLGTFLQVVFDWILVLVCPT